MYVYIYTYIRVCITPPVYDRVVRATCPCERHRATDAAVPKHGTSRRAPRASKAYNRAATAIMQQTFYPKPDATCKERMQHATKRCNTEDKDATCNERMQHATCTRTDATCKTRMQHARQGCNMQHAPGRMPRSECRGGVARALTVTLRER
jgi:hypothetical protein